MYQGTTPTIPMTFKGIDLTSAKIFVTIEDDKTHELMTFTSGDDFTVEYDYEHQNTVGYLSLTQEQTLKLTAGNCAIQPRYIFADGQAGACAKAKLHINPVILKKVIQYG